VDILIDQQFKYISNLIGLLREEDKNQLLKWGIQKRSPFEWMTYLTEEIGELAQAISENHYRDGSYLKVLKEAIQSATLCLKIAEMYMAYYDGSMKNQKIFEEDKP